MAQALCLLHANCQGDALRPLLENSPAFASRFRICQYVNYTRQSIAAQDIEHCDLFLYQRLAPKWGDLSTEQMLPRLPQHCQAIEIPNLFFKGYWPHWSRDEQINFADSLLETLLEKVMKTRPPATSLWQKRESILLFTGTGATVLLASHMSVEDVLFTIRDLADAQQVLVDQLREQCGCCDKEGEKDKPLQRVEEEALQREPQDIVEYLREQGVCLRQLARKLEQNETIFL